MGVKGLSAKVIKQIWRDLHLKDVAAGSTLIVDGNRWLHKAAVSNARHICLENTAEHGHRVAFAQRVQNLLARYR